MKRTAVLAALLLASSCSLIDVADRIQQAPCASDADCEVLNTREDSTFDVCHPFACNTEQLCERTLLDADHDGYAAAGCERDPARQDCNDSPGAADIHPGAAELCNQRDDDCDYRSDEGLLETQTQPMLGLAETQPLHTLTFAPSAWQDKLLVGYVMPESASADLALYELAVDADSTSHALPLQLPSSFAGEPRAPHPLTLALSYLPSSRVAVAGFVEDAVPRVLAGSLQWSDAALGLSPRIARYGLSCAASELCASNAQAALTAEPMPTPPSSHFALATSNVGTLVMYARVPPPTAANYACTGQTGEPEQLLANLLVSGLGDLSERTQHASEIAMTNGPDSAALLALPASPALVAQGFLVAFSDDSGALVLYQLRPTVSHDGVQRSEVLLRWPAVPGGWHSPQLAFGQRVSADVQELGIVAVSGCGLERRVVASLARIQAQDSGITALSVLTPGTELAVAAVTDGQYAPAVAWNDAQRTWGITYRDGASIRLQTYNEDLMALSGEYVLSQSGAIAEGNGDALAILPTAAANASFAVFHQTVSASGLYGVARSRLQACTP